MKPLALPSANGKILTAIILVGSQPRGRTINGATSMFGGPYGYNLLRWRNASSAEAGELRVLEGPLQNSLDYARKIGMAVDEYIVAANETLETFKLV